MADLNDEQLRAALGWETDDYDKAKQPSTNPIIWLWEVLQGDFNENASTAQSLTAAAIGALPLVGQISTLRDFIADCKLLVDDPKKIWLWVALALTLITVFPSLGALFKGVLRIVFGVIRRSGADAVTRAINIAMAWVVSYLRRRGVQEYITKTLKIDDIFTWLAKKVEALKASVTVKSLVEAFDKAIAVLESLSAKVSAIPVIGERARAVVAKVKEARQYADEGFAKGLTPVLAILDEFARKLEMQAMEGRGGIVNANNVHFRGPIPEDVSIRLMRKKRPLPAWLSDGDKWDEAVRAKYEPVMENKVKEGWPSLTDDNVKSFHEFAPDEIRGPARLYRVIAPGSRAMSDCWVSEAVFNKLQRSADPRTSWRKFLAVWPDWNVNGQFVVYDIKRGESLKVWRGPTASQFRKKKLGDLHLEGGWEQIIFNVDYSSPVNDTIKYYKAGVGPEHVLRDAIDDSSFRKLSGNDKKSYTAVRETINHPNISGPFETGWGYTDFGDFGVWTKLGLPNLPGQLTTVKD